MASTEQDGSISQEGDEVEELLCATFSSSDTYDCCKKLLPCNDINEVGSHALNFVQTLQLGKLGKGAVSSAAKFKFTKPALAYSE